MWNAPHVSTRVYKYYNVYIIKSVTGTRTQLHQQQVMRLRIQELCKKYDLNISELAERCGVAQPALSDYNRGKRNPTLDTIAKIAGPFDVPARELIDEPDEIDRNIKWFSRFSPKERLMIAERDTRETQHLQNLQRK